MHNQPHTPLRRPLTPGSVAVVAALLLVGVAPASALTTFNAARPVSVFASSDSCEFLYSYGYCNQERYPTVAADGTGVVIVAWNSTVDLSGVNGTEARLLFVRSTDAGRTWSVPAYLDAFAGPPDGLYSGATLVSNGNGDFVAAWPSSAVTTPTPGLALIHSTDGGQTWTPATTAGPAGSAIELQANPTTGTIVMTGAASVQRSLDGGATWGNFQALSEGDSYRGFRLANDGASTWMMAWSPYYSDARVSVSVDDGATWSAFSIAFEGGTSPAIASDGAGTWYLATLDSQYPSYNNLVAVARSTDAGATWTVPRYLSAKSDSYESPSLLARGGGHLELIMIGAVDGNAGNDSDIVSYFSIDDGDNWSRVRALTGSARIGSAGAGGSGVDTNLAVTASGDSTIAVWVSNESLRFDLGEGVDLGYDPDVLVAVGTARCPSQPRVDCRAVGAEGSSSLKVKHSSSGGDKFKWSWKRGAATTLGEFGDPTADTDYVLCMYSIESAQTRLIVEQHMDTDGLCRFEDCWQPQSSGYAYGDGAGISGAIRRISLVPGDDGRASISAQGSGPSLGFPLLPVFGLTQMHLQLVKWRDGSCWESVLDEIQSNTDKSLSLIGH